MAWVTFLVALFSSPALTQRWGFSHQQNPSERRRAESLDKISLKLTSHRQDPTFPWDPTQGDAISSFALT